MQQKKHDLPVARPTTKPAQAPDIETVPLMASVTTHTIPAPAAAMLVFVIANAATPVQ